MFNSCVSPQGKGSVRNKDSWYSYFVAISIAFCQAEIMGLYSTIPVFLKSLSNDATLGFPSENTLSFAQSAVMFVNPVAGLLAGYVTDRFGARLSLFIASIGAILSPLSFVWASEFGGSESDADPSTHKTRVALMIACYGFAQGFLALGFLTAPGPAVIGSWFSDELVAFGVGIGEFGVASGTALMPLAAGLLVEKFDPNQNNGDWRSAMRWLAVFGVVPLVLSFVTIQRPHDGDGDGDKDENENEEDQQKKSENNNIVEDSERLLGGNEETARKSSINEDTDGASEVFIDDAKKNGEGEPAPDQQQDTFKDELFAKLKSKSFIVLFCTQFLFGYAYFQFIFTAIPYAKIMGSNSTIYADADVISQTDASALMTPFGVTSAVGALVFGGLAAKLNNRVVLAGSQLVGGVLITFVVPVLRTYLELAIVYAIIGAVASSALTTIPSMVVETFIDTPHLINSIMSASFAGFGIAGAIAPPVTSAIQEASSQQGSYRWSFFIGGICMLTLGVYHSFVEFLNRKTSSSSPPLLDEEQSHQKQQQQQQKRDSNYGTLE